MLWWLIKVQIFIFIFIWLRGTLPRMRYDQFMRFGWKVLIPVSIVWIMVVSVARLFRNDYSLSTTQILVGGAIVVAVLLVVSYALTSRADKRALAAEEAEQARRDQAFDPMASAFPVPPMPGQQFTYTSRRAMAAGTTIVQEPVRADDDAEGTDA